MQRRGTANWDGHSFASKDPEVLVKGWQAGKPWQAMAILRSLHSQAEEAVPKSQESTCHSSSQVAVVHSWQRKLRWNFCLKTKLHRNLDCILTAFLMTLKIIWLYCALNQQKEAGVKFRCPLLGVKFPTLRTRKHLCWVLTEEGINLVLLSGCCEQNGVSKMYVQNHIQCR